MPTWRKLETGEKNPFAVAAGKARMAKLTPEGRKALSRSGAVAAKLKRAERSEAMIRDVLALRVKLGIIAESEPPTVVTVTKVPTEDQRLIGDIKRRMDRMRATEARAEGRFVKYDRAG